MKLLAIIIAAVFLANGGISLAQTQPERIPFNQRPGVKTQEIIQLNTIQQVPKGQSYRLNDSIYAKSKTTEDDERVILRRQWTKMLGFDIFYPYFKVKQVETWVKEKTSVKVFKLRGRSEIKSNKFQYVFKVNF